MLLRPRIRSSIGPVFSVLAVLVGPVWGTSSSAALEESVIATFCTDWEGDCEKLAETVLTISRTEAERFDSDKAPSWILKARNSERSAQLIMEPQDAFEVEAFSDNSYEVKLVQPQKLFKAGVGNNYFRVPVSALYVVSTHIEVSGSSESQCYSVATFKTNSGDEVDVQGLDYELRFSPKESVEKYFTRSREFLIKPAPGFAGQKITATLSFEGSRELKLRPLHLILCNTKAIPTPEKKPPADAPTADTSATSEKMRFIPRIALGGTLNPTTNYAENTSLPGLILAIELENAPRFYVRAEAELTAQNLGTVGLPYLDLRFTPYFFDPRKQGETQGVVTLLSGSASRNIHTGRDLQIRVSAAAFEGRAYTASDRVLQAYVDAAARLLALNIEGLRSNPNGLAAGLGLGDIEFKAGVQTERGKPVVFRIYLGGLAQANMGFQTSSLDLRGQAGMSLEILNFLEIFVRAQLENLNQMNQISPYPANLRLVTGIGFIF